MKEIEEEGEEKVIMEIQAKAEDLTPTKLKRELEDEEKGLLTTIKEVTAKRPIKRRRKEYANTTGKAG